MAMDMSLGKLREMVRDREAGVLQSMGLQRGGHDWATGQQQQSRTYPEELFVGNGTFVFLVFLTQIALLALFSHLFFPKSRGFFIVLLQIT